MVQPYFKEKQKIIVRFFQRAKKGVSLYFVMVVLSVLTTGLLSLLSISLSQIKMVRLSSDSFKAFYGTDSGIEQCLYRLRKQGNFESFSGEVGGVSFQVSVSTTTDEVIVVSKGSFRKTKRAVRAVYE